MRAVQDGRSGLPNTWESVDNLATTWIFDYEGERSYIQRQDEPDRILIRTWSSLDQGATVVHSEFEAVQLVRALEQELASRGWVLIEECPERRAGADRRSGERATPGRRHRFL